MNIKTFLHLAHFDKDGNLIEEKEQECNSLVKGFIGILNAQSSQSAEVVVEIGGVSRNGTATASNFSTVAAGGLVTRGIIVGTGTTAVAYTQYVLVTPVAHGTGASQLSYGTQVFDAASTDTGSAYYFGMNRSFTNSSGGDINIKEVGIYSQWATAYSVMVERTLLDHNITNGTSITLTYKWQIT